MNTTLASVFLLVSAAFSATPARAQCGTWQQLGNLGYTGGAPTPTALVGDDRTGLLVASMNCYCGYHGAHVPSFLRWTGANWLEWPLTEFDVGDARGVGLFDLGAGPVAYMWGWRQPGGNFFDRMNEATGFAPATNLAPPPATAIEVFDDGSGPTFYAGQETGAVLRWSGTAWVSITPAGMPNGIVTVLGVHDDGSGPALYAGGTFTSIDGVAANGVARFDGAAWSALGTGIPMGGTRRIDVLRSIQDSTGRALYVGGRFDVAGGSPVNGLARWNGTSWTDLAAMLPDANAEVSGIEWFEDGSGDGPRLTVKVSAATHSIRRFDGVSWTPLTATPPGFVLRYGPMTQVRFPNSARSSLVTTVQQPGWPMYTFGAFHGCEGTGTITCVADGSAGPCPCGNDSTPAERAGCLNSLGTGGVLRAQGDPQLTHDTLVLQGSAMNSSSVLYFQGGSIHAPIPFGDGLKCTGGPFVRLATKTNVGGASQFPTAGDASVSVRGLVAAPATRHYEARYRNSANFCTSATFNYTNSVTILWQP